jgi:hypothetical protein
MRTVHAVVSLLLAATSIAAQGPVQQPPKDQPPTRGPLQSNEMAMTVSGCVRGARLRIPAQAIIELPFRALRVREFVLEGPKELVQQIKREHDGHFDEIAGVVIVPPSPGRNEAPVTTREVAGGRLTVGAERTGTNPGEPQRPVRLRIESFTHVRNGCSDR